MDRLLATLSVNGNARIVRCAAHELLHASFGHLFYDVEVPLTGDGAAMCTLLAASAALDSSDSL